MSMQDTAALKDRRRQRRPCSWPSRARRANANNKIIIILHHKSNTTNNRNKLIIIINSNDAIKNNINKHNVSDYDDYIHNNY